MPDAIPTPNPSQTALLIMDYQPAILDSHADPSALLTRVADAVATVRAAGAHVGYVRVAFEDRDYDAIPPENKMFAPIAGTRFLHHEDPSTDVHEHVKPEPGDIVVRKTRVGAFSTTNLNEQLKAHGVSTLILAGINTSGVVLSTVRDAADRDYQVYVLSDATADPEADVHSLLTEKVFPLQAHVITTDELRTLFTKTARDRI